MLKQQFEEFHKKNPKVFEMFEVFAFQAIRSGRKHFGAKAIIERIRWEVNIATSGDIFKINNNMTCFYSRLFEQVHPEYKGFFKTRSAQADLI